MFFKRQSLLQFLSYNPIDSVQVCIQCGIDPGQLMLPTDGRTLNHLQRYNTVVVVVVVVIVEIAQGLYLLSMGCINVLV